MSVFGRYMRSEQEAADRIPVSNVALVHCKVTQVTSYCGGLTLARSQTPTLPFAHSPFLGKRERNKRNSNEGKKTPGSI